jgi:hypothetical protein
MGAPYPSPSPLGVTPGNRPLPNLVSPTPAGGTDSRLGGGTFGGAGLINQNQPQNAVRQYMQSHGMDPDSTGFFGDMIKKIMGNLVPALMSLTLDSNGQPALDQLADLNLVLDPIFYGGAGTLGHNLNAFADTAQQGLMGALPGLKGDTQADLLRNLTALRTLPMNPYMGNAVNNRLDAAIGAAQDYQFGLAQQGKTPPHEWSLLDFILHQLPRGYANPFR